MDKPATQGGGFAPIDYVKKSKKDTTRMHGQANSMKDLLETIKQDKHVETELIRRHGDYSSSSQIQATDDKKGSVPSAKDDTDS